MSQAMIQTTVTTAIPAGLLNKRMAAKYYGICEKTLDNLVKRGTITPVRLTRKVMFRREDLDSAIEAARSPKPISRPAEASGAKVGG